MGKHRRPIEITTRELCKYGCGRVAKWQTVAGHLICEPSHSRCPALLEKNAAGVKCSHSRGRDYSHLKSPRRTVWNKGLSKNTHPSLKRESERRSGIRRISDPDRLAKTIYREQCEFDLTGIIDKVKGYNLLKKFGMYSRTGNPGGVVRDHRISIDEGWKKSIPPEIIRHPANCEFLLHSVNSQKTLKSSILLEDLIEEIEKFNAGVFQLVEKID